MVQTAEVRQASTNFQKARKFLWHGELCNVQPKRTVVKSEDTRPSNDAFQETLGAIEMRALCSWRRHALPPVMPIQPDTKPSPDPFAPEALGRRPEKILALLADSFFWLSCSLANSASSLALARPSCANRV